MLLYYFRLSRWNKILHHGIKRAVRGDRPPEQAAAAALRGSDVREEEASAKSHMDWRVVAFVLLLCNVFFSPWNGVEGYDRLSPEEDAKLEEELSLLNKPAVTIHPVYGDTYDCVDFYKQPAFDDPLLKNHNFHPGMEPGMIPHRSPEEKNVQGLKHGECPFGTVPIRRTTKDDLISAKMHQKMFSRITPNDETGHYHAVVRHDTPNHGAGGEFNIYNLPVAAPQFTSGQLKIMNEDESLKVGWTVNPSAYGDNQTHMFAVMNAGGRSCFNTQCGFVQVNQQVPVGVVMEPVSTYDGDQYAETFFVYQDPTDSNWYFQITRNHMVLGFWPKELFTKLRGGATAVEWGGEVFSPPGTPAPGMGSGHEVVFNAKKTGVANQCKVVINGSVVDPPLRARDAKVISQAPYYAQDLGYQHRYGRIIVYGHRRKSIFCRLGSYALSAMRWMSMIGGF